MPRQHQGDTIRQTDTTPAEDAILRLDNQVCFPVYAAANLITRLYRPELDRLGLTYPQYLVMLALWEKTPRSVSELGACLYLDSGTLTPLLKRMENAGHITRTRDAADERRVHIDLTTQGHALKKDAIQIPARLCARTGVGLEDLTDLRDRLHRLVAALASDHAGVG